MNKNKQKVAVISGQRELYYRVVLFFLHYCMYVENNVNRKHRGKLNSCKDKTLVTESSDKSGPPSETGTQVHKLTASVINRD